MKETFINNLGKRLIEENNFNVADTSFIPAIINKYTYIKDTWGALNIVNFIDADVLNFSFIDNIKSQCLHELDLFKEKSNADYLSYYKVFVTEAGIDENIKNSLLSFNGNFLFKRSAFIPVVVDLSKNEVISGKKGGDKTGLISALKLSISQKDKYTNIYDLESIQKNTGMDYITDASDKGNKVSRPYITYALIVINLAMFVLTSLYGGSKNLDVLIKYGAKVNSLIMKGQYWRFITSAFLHGDIAHIAFNMYALYSIGSLTERIYGHSKYIFIYFTAAVAGSICSFIFSTAPSVGASGAIFGLLGAILYLTQKKPKILSTSFGINVLVVIGFNLIYGFTNAGIDNFAHMGGLIGGYLAANAIGLRNESRVSSKKNVILAITLVLLISGVFIGTKKNMTSWNYYYEMAADSYVSGSMEEARGLLEKAVNLNPKAAEARALLSLVYYNEGNEQQGKEEFDRAVNLDKDQPNLYFNLGNYFFSNKRYSESEDMFKRFVEIQPKAYEGYLNLGVAQNLQGKYDEAEPNLKKAVEIKPGDFLANADLGYLYTDKGDYPKAKVYLQKAAQIDPGDSDVQKTLSLIKSKGY
jgi:Uncharacterized membrane protein (homolog of Drosophila rhomboid)